MKLLMHQYFRKSDIEKWKLYLQYNIHIRIFPSLRMCIIIYDKFIQKKKYSEIVQINGNYIYRRKT